MDLSRLPLPLLDVARERSDVLRRGELAAHGVSAATVRAQLVGRRWQAVGPVVIALHNGPLTAEQKCWAAVLTAPGLVAVAGRHAAHLAGLRGWDPGVQPEIVVPRGHHVPPLPFPVRVHESRRLSADDLHPTVVPPRTRVERAVIDAATWSNSPRTACGLLAAAVQQRLTTADRLAGELARAGKIRHRALLRAVLDDIAGGAQSLNEADFGAFLRRHDLPAARRQVVRIDRFGKRRYLDAELVGPGGAVLHVELDGALHLLVSSYWEDMKRSNELILTGSRLLRFPSISCRLEGDVVADQIRRGLGLTVRQRAA